jgi:hypothetical protein
LQTLPSEQGVLLPTGVDLHPVTASHEYVRQTFVPEHTGAAPFVHVPP